MGAQEFVEVGYGGTAQEAFNNARQESAHKNGHGGYTGTIAEKHSFKLIACEQTDEAINARMESCMENEGHFVQDKWGPAGCIKIKEGQYIFFGVASS